MHNPIDKHPTHPRFEPSTSEFRATTGPNEPLGAAAQTTASIECDMIQTDSDIRLTVKNIFQSVIILPNDKQITLKTSIYSLEGSRPSLCLGFKIILYVFLELILFLVLLRETE